LNVLASDIVLSLDVVFVGHNELRDHVPEQMFLVFLAGWHRRAKIVYLRLTLL